MKRYMVVSGVALLAAMSVTVHAGWMKTYGGTGNELGWYVQQTTDGGYIVLGYTSSDSGDIWFLKTDATGDTLWTKIYGGPAPEGGHSAQQTKDGGYIIAGYTGSFGAGKYDLWLFKTDANGETVWTRTYGGPDYDAGYCVQQTKDGGYIIAGYRDGKRSQQSGPIEGGDVWLVKTNANGDSLWSKTYVSEEVNGQGEYVRQTKDGGYIIACFYGFDSTTGERVNLIKTDDSGDSVWTYRDASKLFNCVQEVSDGTYIAAGDGIVAAGNTNVDIAKIDKNGKLLWSSNYGTELFDDADYINVTPDGGFIITGIYGLIFTGGGSMNGDLWLLRTDADGDTLWTRIYGKNPQYDAGWCVCPTSDGGYIVTGLTKSFGAGGSDVWLIKTDSNGKVSVDETPVSVKNRNWQIVTSVGKRIVLEYKNRPDGFHAAVFDASGRKVDEIRRTESSGTISLGEGYSPGVYFIRLQSDNSLSTQKVVLVR